MLRLSRFEFIAADSVDHATQLLHRYGPEAMLMAGGTDLLVNIKHRLVTPRLVIGLRHLPELGSVSHRDGGWLSIGAGVTLRMLESHPGISAHYPALAHAAYLVSSPQVRSQATIGGNVCLDVRCNYYNQSHEWRKAIGFCMKKDSEVCRVAPGGDRCWAVASADTVPVLIALRAEADVLGVDGQRRVPLESLYQDDGLQPHTLRFGEIVTALHLPPTAGYTTVYQKYRIRHSFDFPLAAVASSVRLDADARVEDARIVMTAVAAYPERATNAEHSLIGKPLTTGTIEGAGALVYRLAKPMDNTAGSIFHRKRMAKTLLERGLREIAGMGEPKRNTA